MMLEELVTETGIGSAYLELVDEHSDGVELIVRVRRVSHGERDGGMRSAMQFWTTELGLERWSSVSAARMESSIACEVM